MLPSPHFFLTGGGMGIANNLYPSLTSHLQEKVVKGPQLYGLIVLFCPWRARTDGQQGMFLGVYII